MTILETNDRDVTEQADTRKATNDQASAGGHCLRHLEKKKTFSAYLSFVVKN